MSLPKHRPEHRLPNCDFLKTGVGCANCGVDGFVDGTTILTKHGWRDVATLAKGDHVWTLEHDWQPIMWTEGRDIWRQPGTCPASVSPIWVPMGALGNQQDLLVQGETFVAIASADFQAITGHSHALVSGFDCEGFNGIELYQPEAPRRLYEVHFENEELVAFGGGAIACCPSFLGALNFDPHEGEANASASASGLPKLSSASAVEFLNIVTEELADQAQVQDQPKAAS